MVGELRAIFAPCAVHVPGYVTPGAFGAGSVKHQMVVVVIGAPMSEKHIGGHAGYQIIIMETLVQLFGEKFLRAQCKPVHQQNEVVPGLSFLCFLVVGFQFVHPVKGGVPVGAFVDHGLIGKRGVLKEVTVDILYRNESALGLSVENNFHQVHIGNRLSRFRIVEIRKKLPQPGLIKELGIQIEFVVAEEESSLR